MKQTLLEQLEGKHNETPQAVEEDDETSGRDGSDFEGAMGETAAMMLQLISSTKPPLHPKNSATPHYIQHQKSSARITVQTSRQVK